MIQVRYLLLAVLVSALASSHLLPTSAAASVEAGNSRDKPVADHHHQPGPGAGGSEKKEHHAGDDDDDADDDDEAATDGKKDDKKPAAAAAVEKMQHDSADAEPEPVVMKKAESADEGKHEEKGAAHSRTRRGHGMATLDDGNPNNDAKPEDHKNKPQAKSGSNTFSHGPWSLVAVSATFLSAVFLA